jgi:hypothetical protein
MKKAAILGVVLVALWGTASFARMEELSKKDWEKSYPTGYENEFPDTGYENEFPDDVISHFRMQLMLPPPLVTKTKLVRTKGGVIPIPYGIESRGTPENVFHPGIKIDPVSVGNPGNSK